MVEQLMTAAFGRARDPGSNEYMDGCRALLERKVNSVPLKCPHRMGTVQADAWYSGTNEGHAIWIEYELNAPTSEMGHTSGSDSYVNRK